LHFWRQTDKQTDEQMDSIDALSRSLYRERRLDKAENINTKEIKQYSGDYDDDGDDGTHALHF